MLRTAVSIMVSRPRGGFCLALTTVLEATLVLIVLLRAISARTVVLFKILSNCCGRGATTVQLRWPRGETAV